MYCSPLQSSARTIIPAAIREWLGALLSGPLPGSRTRRHAACLFALGRIGDFVLTLSALRLLVREFGATNCVLVVPNPLAILAGREFPGVQCITLPTEAASLMREILPIWWRERNKFSADSFDQLICLSHQRSLYYELALSWIDTARDVRLLPETYPTVSGEDVPASHRPDDGGPASHRLSDGWCTELLAHQRLVETVLGRAIGQEEILPRFTSLTASEDGRLLIYPFSRDATRCLPLEKVVGVLQNWRARSRGAIVFGGNLVDTPELERYAQAARSTGLDNISIELPSGLDGLLKHVAQAGAVFAADSAAAHVATALDKPSAVMTTRLFYGYCQPWGRSGRQHVFLPDAPADQVAGALPAL